MKASFIVDYLERSSVEYDPGPNAQRSNRHRPVAAAGRGVRITSRSGHIHAFLHEQSRAVVPDPSAFIVDFLPSAHNEADTDAASSSPGPFELGYWAQLVTPRRREQSKGACVPLRAGAAEIAFNMQKAIQEWIATSSGMYRHVPFFSISRRVPFAHFHPSIATVQPSSHPHPSLPCIHPTAHLSEREREREREGERERNTHTHTHTQPDRAPRGHGSRSHPPSPPGPNPGPTPGPKPEPGRARSPRRRRGPLGQAGLCPARHW